MAVKFWDFLRPKSGKVEAVEIACCDMWNASKELAIRELCFYVCLNMVANAIGRCEFRTYREFKEVKEREYYLWNVEPNVNENSTRFLHKLICKLYEDNDALAVSVRKRNGSDALVVADEWDEVVESATRQTKYRNVSIGGEIHNYNESDVIRLKLNNGDIKRVLDMCSNAYGRLLNAAMTAFSFGNGQHWKVHVSALAQGDPDWRDNFQAMLEKQVKPFFESTNGILPEFDGYLYEDIGTSRSTAKASSEDVREMIEDIFNFTARAFGIPIVLVNGKVESTKDAYTRFLTGVIDPICDQLQEEIIRKRYGYDEWVKGNFLRVDSSAIIHFDIFSQAADIEKLVGSGAYTINDVRRAAGEVEIDEDWANRHYMTLNIGTMSTQVRDAGKEE